MKFISVNIEGRRHLERLASFLETEQPDVVCMQELCEVDVDALAQQLGKQVQYVPMSYAKHWGSNIGVAIFADVFETVKMAQYAGVERTKLSPSDDDGVVEKYHRTRYQLIRAAVPHGGEVYHIVTTHMPVTIEGAVADFQTEALQGLLAALGAEEVVLTGDFNAPRGRATFAILADRYTDNIPPQYTTSLDQELHKAAPIELMVDGLFTTPHYQTDDVRLQSGVSDHCAIVATLKKV